MNGYGVIVAVVCFFCIGIFHPIVIKAEYYFSSRCWPVFLGIGAALLIGSLYVNQMIGSIILGVLGCSCLWCILELKEQKERVERGWFPKNPKRKDASCTDCEYKNN